jgi:hypothetical protein
VETLLEYKYPPRIKLMVPMVCILEDVKKNKNKKLVDRPEVQ